MVALHSKVIANSADPRFPLPHAFALTILDDGYCPPPLRWVGSSASLGASSSSYNEANLKQEWKAWQPERTQLEFPANNNRRPWEVSAIKTMHTDTTILVAAGTSLGSIVLWAHTPREDARRTDSAPGLSDSDDEDNADIIVKQTVIGRQVEGGTVGISSLDFALNIMRLVAVDDDGTVFGWDVKLSPDGCIDTVILGFRIDAHKITEQVVAVGVPEFDQDTKPVHVHHGESHLDTMKLCLAMSNGVVLNCRCVSSSSGEPASQESRSKLGNNKKRRPTVDVVDMMNLAHRGPQHDLSHNSTEVLFVRALQVGDKSFVTTFDRSGTCAVWAESEVGKDDVRVLWHHHVATSSAQLKSPDVYNESNKTTVSKGEMVFNRRAMQLACVSEGHQIAVVNAINRLLESHSLAEIHLAGGARYTSEQQHSYLPRWQEEKESGTILTASHDDSGSLVRVTAKEARRCKPRSRVLNVVPAAKHSAFCVLEHRSGDGPGVEDVVPIVLEHGDTLTVHTVAVEPGGDPYLEGDLTVARTIYASNDIGTRLSDCRIAVLTLANEDECLLMRLGVSLYVYSGRPFGRHRNEPLRKLHVPCPERGGALVAATESAVFVCASSRGLQLINANNAPPSSAPGHLASFAERTAPRSSPRTRSVARDADTEASESAPAPAALPPLPITSLNLQGRR